MKTKNYFEIDSSGRIRKSNRGINKIKSINRNGLALYTDLGFYIVIPLLLGLFIGYLFDIKFGIKPIGVLIGIFLGLVASFYNLLRYIRTNVENKY